MPKDAAERRVPRQARELDPPKQAQSTESLFADLKKTAEAGREDRGYPRPR